MNRAPINAPIRKITIGDPQGGFAFQVGQQVRPKDGGASFKPFEITRIVRDENNYFIFKQIVYIIYAKRLDGGPEFVWNYFERQTIRVECFQPEDNVSNTN